MVHYNLLKLKEGADAAAILAQCQAVYAALEAELPSGEETLADRLMDLDVFTRIEWRSARELVSTERL